jgi:hypothetical protein
MATEQELRDAVAAWVKAKRAFKVSQDRSYDLHRKMRDAEAKLAEMTGGPT